MKKTMKKSFLFAGLAMIATLAACDKSEIAVSDDVTVGRTVSLIANTEDTKTVNDGLNTLWAEGDALTVFAAPAGSDEYGANVQFSLSDLENGKFEGTLDLTADAYDWYVFYPYTSQITTPSAPTAGYNYIGGRSDKPQVQAAYDMMDHLAGKNALLYGQVTAVAKDETPAVTMHQIASALEIVVTNGLSEGITISGASFTAPEGIDIVGSYFVDFAGEAPVLTPSNANYVSNVASVTVTTPAELGPGSSAKLYLLIKPFTAAAETQLKLTVTGPYGDQESTVDVAETIAFEAGHIRTLNVTYDKDNFVTQFSSIADLNELAVGSYTGTLEDVVVAYVPDTKNAFIRDATGSTLIFDSTGKIALKQGQTFSGQVALTIAQYQGLNQITVHNAAFAGDEAEVAPLDVTLADLVNTFDAYQNAYVKLEGVEVTEAAEASSRTTYTVSDGANTFAVYMNEKNTAPVAVGDVITAIGTITKYGDLKELKVWKAEGNIWKEAVPTLTIERLWGKYPNTGWPTAYVGAGEDRTIATDGEWVYVAKAGSSVSGIVAISIEDPSVFKNVNCEGVDGGLFKTSCVRTIYDPDTEKYILLASSLTTEAGHLLKIYAWKDGIDAAPTTLLSWEVAGYRRFGDFFTTTGTFKDGELWFRNNTDNTDHRCDLCARFTLKDGALTAQWPDAFSLGYNGSKGRGSLYFYEKGKADVLLVTDAIGMFFDVNNGPGGKEWTNGTDYSAWKNRFGFTPFEYNGQKFIAYQHMYNAARSWLTILNDTQGTSEGFMQTLIDNDIVFQAAVQIEKDEPSTEVVSGATYTDQTMANCSVAVMADHVIIVGHQHNTGLAVFKMYMK